MSKKKNKGNKVNIGRIHYDMMRRCYNPNNAAYKDYGAKGITVCPEWHDRESFRTWALSNGYQKGLRLNRKDSSKGYCPDNCFWGTTSVVKDRANKRNKARAAENRDNKMLIGLKRLTDSPFYDTFNGMHARCDDPKNTAYERYGGRGIKVCEEWSGPDGVYNFILWANSSEWQPGLTLDRIDNNKGYSPDNCRWATSYEQANNTRRNVYYNYKGQSLTLSQIARIEGVDTDYLRYRVREKGMELNEAIEEARQITSKKRKEKNHE